MPRYLLLRNVLFLKVITDVPVTPLQKADLLRRIFSARQHRQHRGTRLALLRPPVWHRNIQTGKIQIQETVGALLTSAVIISEMRPPSLPRTKMTR
ncbi:hypothetical protein F2P81_004205 [Scophthalmus maximus]|uniref:Uncharacterized protein n=1 Tax=Scophthalmus maximus TaxID=52904 RepID=A0A6A4TEL9_SCOMX|nr:hypothetical protein F2P81_004205 [Scophthalmus maximus]